MPRSAASRCLLPACSRRPRCSLRAACCSDSCSPAGCRCSRCRSPPRSALRPGRRSQLAALAIHAIGVLAAALTAAAYGVDASLAVWFSIIPVSLIATAVPISINGWGVREAVIVALAAGHGIAAADALVVSITLGVLNVVASLPGAYLLVFHDSR